MILKNIVTDETVNLPDTLYWEDEFSWSNTVMSKAYTLTGALVVNTSARKSGRLITLKPPSADMAWVTRSVVNKILDWANNHKTVMELQFTQQNDNRKFRVMFNSESNPLESNPVKGFPEASPDTFTLLTLKLIEVKEDDYISQ